MIPPPTLALHTSRCGKRLVLLAALTGLTAFPSSAVAGAQPSQGGTVSVMTQNMYTGNIGTITSAPHDQLQQAVAKFFKETVATNPKQRATAIAKKIHDNHPDLVALQEVGILRRGTNNDATIPATKVEHDQLQLLRDALNLLGDQYYTVAVIPNSDLQLPSTLGYVVRITDRSVILARASSNDLKLSNAQVEEYSRQPVVSAVPQRSNASASKRIRCCAHALRTSRSAATRQRASSMAACNGFGMQRATHSHAMRRLGLIATVGDWPTEQFLRSNPTQTEHRNGFEAKVRGRRAILASAQVRSVLDGDGDNRNAVSDRCSRVAGFMNRGSLAQTSSHAFESSWRGTLLASSR
jgi:hypothetical protein